MVCGFLAARYIAVVVAARFAANRCIKPDLRAEAVREVRVLVPSRARSRPSEDGRAGHMGKRSAAGELFLGNMGTIQRETRPSIQREDQLTMPQPAPPRPNGIGSGNDDERLVVKEFGREVSVERGPEDRCYHQIDFAFVDAE
jgi:hypothetical protein